MRRASPVLVVIAVVVAVAWWFGAVDRPGREPGPREPAAPSVDPARDESPAPPAAVPEEDEARELLPTWTLVVDVRGPGGVLQPDIDLRFRDDRGIDVASGCTDEAGTASLVARGPGHLVVVGTADLPSVTIEGLDVPPSGARRVAVDLGPGLAVAGVVLRQDGVTPADEARVTLRLAARPPWAEDLWRDAETGADGHFCVTGLPAGTYHVEIRPDEEDHGASPEPSPEIAAGDEAVCIVLDPLAVVRVRVVDVGSGPERKVTAMRVYAADGRRLSSHGWSGMGTARELLLRPGARYRFEAGGEGWQLVNPVELDLHAEEREAKVTVELRPDGRARATLLVRARIDGDVVPDRVSVSYEVDASLSRKWNLETADGAVEFEVPAGPRRVSIGRPEEPGGGFVFERPWLPTWLDLDLAPGSRAVREVVLRTGGWLRVRADEIHDTPIYLGREGEELEEVGFRSAPGGGYLPWCDPLEPGRWVIERRRPHREPERRVVEVRAGEITDVDLESS